MEDGFYLRVLLVFAVLTELKGQCSHDNSLPLRVNASQWFTRDILSPNYPHKYPDRAHCEWRIAAGPGLVVHVHVNSMDLEEEPHCIYDSLTFYDGFTSTWPMLSRLCKDHVGDIYSSTTHMTIVFTSDQSIRRGGFRLRYRALPLSQVPVTTTSTTTSMPWWITRQPSTTSSTNASESSGFNWGSHINTAALIGGLTAGLLLLFVFCALCRYYYSRQYGRRPTRRPYFPGPPPTGAVPAQPHPHPSTIYQNNNAVFMVSSPHLTPSAPPYRSGGGLTNMAFSPYGEAPPAYYSVPGAPADESHCPPPPSYSEAMMLTYPPASLAAGPSPSLGPFQPPGATLSPASLGHPSVSGASGSLHPVRSPSSLHPAYFQATPLGCISGGPAGIVQGTGPGTSAQRAGPGEIVQGAGPNILGQRAGPGISVQRARQGAVPSSLGQGAGPATLVQSAGPGTLVQRACPGEVVQEAGPGPLVKGAGQSAAPRGIVQAEGSEGLLGTEPGRMGHGPGQSSSLQGTGRVGMIPRSGPGLVHIVGQGHPLLGVEQTNLGQGAGPALVQGNPLTHQPHSTQLFASAPSSRDPSSPPQVSA